MARNLKPVSIAGIEGDALISEDISYSADIPEYPVENGYNVSDTIILKPIQLSITLYISDSPATWRNRKGHSPSAGRTKKICEKQEALKREIMEELDTKVKIGNLIDTIEYDYPNFHLLMDCFWCEIVSGELKLKEHENAKWLTKEHLDEVEWLPADVILIDKIRMDM